MPSLLTDKFDLPGYQGRFASKGRIRLEGAVSAEAADALHHALEQQTPWSLQLVTRKGMPDVISRAELESLPPTTIQTRLQDAAERATEGLSYLRLGYLLNASGLQALGPIHPLAELAGLIASSGFSAFLEGLTGLSGLEVTRLEALCYRPGDFFTQHTDSDARLTMEWNFTEGWRSDWGGQVLFHSPSGDIEGGIMPRLNDLSLYNGDQPTSVATVAAFAAVPRFSVVARFI
jgi:SM-20-related protein